MAARTPGLRPASILLVALSLSIGWGIRGNFGHEYGAMIAGTLSAIAACVVSGRPDWRARLPYIAMFGALGWGFGGSISYMQVIAYTHSGHLPSQIYGFAGLFLIGFLWASLGGAGAAFGASADDNRLRDIFAPLGWIFAAWLLLLVLEEPLLERYVSGFNQTLSRHESPLYWFDSDWLQALTALLALFLFDLYDRRFRDAQWLPVFAGGGALLGWGLQAVGVLGPVGRVLLRYEGDVAITPKEQLLINWPQFFVDIPQHVGWMVGLLLGVFVYFAIFGKFQKGASMFVHMAAGWLAAFIALPVLLGARMTPPRGDDWAGILGVFLGLAVYFLRQGMAPALFASITCGIVGGVGFSGIQMMKLVMTSFGNRTLVSDPAIVERWAHWQSANWHSWLEQSYGFVNGLGMALAMGLLATRIASVKDPDSPGAPGGTPRDMPMEAVKLLFIAAAAVVVGATVHPGAAVVFLLAVLLHYAVRRQVLAISFVLFLVPFFNLFKNVAEWVEKGSVPAVMTAPLFDSIEMSAAAWFILTYAIMAGAAIWLMMRHARGRRIALVPASWIGKGQLLFLVFLWMMVVGNFERALVGFSEGRLLTEWVIFINATIVSVLMLVCPREQDAVAMKPGRDWPRILIKAVGAGVAVVLIAVAVETAVTRLIYGGGHTGHATPQFRFGPDATWRVKPIQKGQGHL